MAIKCVNVFQLELRRTSDEKLDELRKDVDKKV